MNTSLGKTLRILRKGKQVSLTSLADDSLSKSQISRFERGESEISCVRLMNLLEKLNLGLDEFILFHQSTTGEQNHFLNHLNYIEREYHQNNIDKLKQLLSNESFALTELEQIMVKSIIHPLAPEMAPLKEELLALTDYLFKVESWGIYEIVLFGNCVRSLPYQTYFLLTKEMLGNTILTSNNKKIIIQVAINCLIVSVDENEFKNGEYLIQEINKHLNHELFYYEKTVFLYATGYFEFKQHKQSGQTKMKQAIQVFELLGENHLKQEYEKHYLEKTHS